MTDPDLTNVHRVSAFAEGSKGGNPAGVLIAETLPPDEEMRAIAAKVGYSETAFASPSADHWHVRYFAPECEVDFCGHATIALGAVLSEINGPGTFPLHTKAGAISVAGTRDESGALSVTLMSPPTQSRPLAPDLRDATLALFGLGADDLDPEFPPAVANAGANHLVLALRDRGTLAGMSYDLEAGRTLMAANGLTTISLLYFETPRLIHSRNAFAVGGILEDPATGAAAAALAGYLRDIEWPHAGQVDIVQGSDMGMPSKLSVTIPAMQGSPVAVSGTTRWIT